MKALIVDDELNCRENLHFLVTNYCSEINEIEMATSVDEAKPIFESFKPDILFLDIQMPEKDGFHLLKLVDTTAVSVIFTTAHDQFAIKAIKCGPTAYLLKPIDIAELKQAVLDSINMLEAIKENSRIYQKALSNLIQDFDSTNDPKRICLAHSSKLQVVNIYDIIYLESDGHYTIFHFSNGTKSVLSKTMKYYEGIIGKNFIRVHRTYLVNLDYIKEYNFDELRIKLLSGKLIDVSRRKSKFVADAIRTINQ